MHYRQSDLHMWSNCRNICISLTLHNALHIFKDCKKTTPDVVPSAGTFMCFFLLLLSLNAIFTLIFENNLLSYHIMGEWIMLTLKNTLDRDTAEKFNFQHRHLFKVWSVLQSLNMLFLTRRLLARGDYRKKDVTETFQAIMWYKSELS